MRLALKGNFIFRILLALTAFGWGGAQASRIGATPAGTGAQTPGPQQLFQKGEAALKGGDLDGAERAFRGVLAIDPESAGAYANLGVIEMRRKRWPQALEMLRKAEHLAPQV